MIPAEFLNYIIKANIPYDCLEAVIDRDGNLAQSEEQKALFKELWKLIDGKYRTLTVSGLQGTGKTWACCGALISNLKTNYWLTDKSCENVIKFTSHYEMELEYKSAMQPMAKRTQADVFRDYCMIPMLCIDEIGRGQTTDYTMSFIENVISKRYANKLPTILITNKTGKELTKLFDASIIDRIANGKEGVVMNMTSTSLR